VREHVALLLQDAPLFDGTVRENVAYGVRSAPEEELRAALDAAAAAGLADELPDGLDTRTGQRGRALSGGQRRRVAMARALLQDAPVLVLDEPSAGLDAEATRRLLGPLQRLMRERATLLVTHDLALAAAADEIVVLDEGRVVERGAPASLALAGGAWARLQGEREPVAA
jgi:ABC-type multidrug transport system fused ATPase/permease subunit